MRQGQFHVLWRKGTVNKADYFTKHHPVTHHETVRSVYLHEPKYTTTRNYFECLQDEHDLEPDDKNENEVTVVPKPNPVQTTHSTGGAVGGPRGPFHHGGRGLRSVQFLWPSRSSGVAYHWT